MPANSEEIILHIRVLPGRDADVAELVTRWKRECRIVSAMVLAAIRGHYLEDKSQLDRIEAILKSGQFSSAQAPMEDMNFDDMILDSNL